MTPEERGKRVAEAITSLMTPEGQRKAIEAGNRQLRGLSEHEIEERHRMEQARRLK